MATKRLTRPRAPVELGKLIGVTGQVEDRDPNDNRNEAAAGRWNK